VLAIGLMYLGWHIAELALADVGEDPRVEAVVAWLGVGTLPGLMATIALGFLAAAMVQSSTAIVAFAIGLVAAEVIPVPAAIAIVLGANVGTAMTPPARVCGVRADRAASSLG
jgi:phosphate:Na+ symporter